MKYLQHCHTEFFFQSTKKGTKPSSPALTGSATRDSVPGQARVPGGVNNPVKCRIKPSEI